MDSPRELLKPDERGLGDAPAKSHGKLALALGSDRDRAQPGSWARLYNLGPSPGARGGGARSADGRFQPAGCALPGTIADVGSAGFAGGCKTRRQPPSSATWRSRINRTRRRRRNLRGSRQPPSSKRPIKPHSRLSNHRQEREAQLAQLQQALGQIAETRRTAMAGLVMTLDSKSISLRL